MTLRKHLILIVDDEPPIVRLVKAKLRLDGYEVLTAARGDEALAMLQEQTPDLVVLDGQHPLLAHISGDDILGRWLFAGLNRMVKDVMVGGQWVVQDGRSADEIEAGTRGTSPV